MQSMDWRRAAHWKTRQLRYKYFITMLDWAFLFSIFSFSIIFPMFVFCIFAWFNEFHVIIGILTRFYWENALERFYLRAIKNDRYGGCFPFLISISWIYQKLSNFASIINGNDKMCQFYVFVFVFHTLRPQQMFIIDMVIYSSSFAWVFAIAIKIPKTKTQMNMLFKPLALLNMQSNVL